MLQCSSVAILKLIVQRQAQKSWTIATGQTFFYPLASQTTQINLCFVIQMALLGLFIEISFQSELFHDSSLFAPPVTSHPKSQGYSNPLGEREVGYPRGWEHIFEFFWYRKNSWSCPGFEPWPPCEYFIHYTMPLGLECRYAFSLRVEFGLTWVGNFSEAEENSFFLNEIKVGDEKSGVSDDGKHRLWRHPVVDERLCVCGCVCGCVGMWVCA